MLGLVAVIIGFVARGRVKRGEATNGGVAIAGIVLGDSGIVLRLVVVIAIWYGVFHEVGGTDYMDCLSKAGSDQEAVQRARTSSGNASRTSSASRSRRLRQRRLSQMRRLGMNSSDNSTISSGTTCVSVAITYRRSPSAWNFRR